MLTRIALKLVEWSRWLPLSWLRALGALLGHTLYWVVVSRRRVVTTNLRLCFPQWSEVQIQKTTLDTFICFAQAWLDRGWLWHGAPDTVRSRVRLIGALQELDGDAPTVIFAPHFMGLDAGWTGLTQQISRRFATIYSPQANAAADVWVHAGRLRFGSPEMVARLDGVKPIIAALRGGEPLYLLPDMNFDPSESVFVPFYGVLAATIPSLSRFARLSRAKVVPVITRMTAGGYDVEILPAWQDFPTADAAADTALMNLRLQGYIDTMPSQYYWVHKRFKDRPSGEAAPY
ncbi:MAG TPA: lipid A biosynthesis acyltransferase [Rhodoferax sp.]|nr:lipid A biosynthesis acyltransferase [Rhodoferax sp.]HQY75909.1 lipid A biosynthesis acyltransferase [Rhodoferax sp.]